MVLFVVTVTVNGNSSLVKGSYWNNEEYLKALTNDKFQISSSNFHNIDL